MKNHLSSMYTAHRFTRNTSRGVTPPQAGFTLVETLVAIFILALTIGALLTLTAGGFFTIRYAKNDITATYLLQESLELIRNDRDSMAQEGKTWTEWTDTYKKNGCTLGCMVSPYAPGKASPVACPSSGKCYQINYDTTKRLYQYGTNGSIVETSTPSAGIIKTTFVRKVTVEVFDTPTPYALVTATMTWNNGKTPKILTQSMIITPWNLK